jgi:hypothetical protein
MLPAGYTNYSSQREIVFRLVRGNLALALAIGMAAGLLATLPFGRFMPGGFVSGAMAALAGYLHPTLKLQSAGLVLSSFCGLASDRVIPWSEITGWQITRWRKVLTVQVGGRRYDRSLGELTQESRDRLIAELRRRVGEPSHKLPRVPLTAYERWEIVWALALPNVVFYVIWGVSRIL